MKKIIQVELDSEDIVQAIKEYCERGGAIEEDMVLHSYDLTGEFSEDNCTYTIDELRNLNIAWEYKNEDEI